jgi:hypothetical protein
MLQGDSEEESWSDNVRLTIRKALSSRKEEDRRASLTTSGLNEKFNDLLAKRNLPPYTPSMMSGYVAPSARKVLGGLISPVAFSLNAATL